MTSAVIVSLRVDASPARAFDVFTGEIGEWWQSSPLFALSPGGDGRLSFEPGEGGRLVTELPNGTLFEIGRISVWEPGVRLVVGWRKPSFAADQSTELDIRFEPIGDQTRITVEHRGWDGIPREHAARHGFELMLFQRRGAEHWQAVLGALGRTIRR